MRDTSLCFRQVVRRRSVLQCEILRREGVPDMCKEDQGGEERAEGRRKEREPTSVHLIEYRMSLLNEEKRLAYYELKIPKDMQEF